MAYTWTLKDKIFGYFGRSSKVNDSYKDVNGKGITERYQESLGEDYDESIGPLIDNFVEKTIDVDNVKDDFVELLEKMVGDPIVIVDTIAFRKNMLKIWQSIVLIKSTRLSYEILFGMVGVTLDGIVLVDNESGFDSSYTLDDVRRFDSGAFCCRHYELHLSGPAMTDELSAIILRIALFLHPIDAELDAIVYGGTTEYFDDYFDDEFA